MSLTPVIPTKHSWYSFFKLPQIGQFGLREHFCRRGKHKLLPFVLRRKDKIEIPLRKYKQSGSLVYMTRLAPIMHGLSWPAIWRLKTDVYVYWKIRPPFHRPRLCNWYRVAHKNNKSHCRCTQWCNTKFQNSMGWNEIEWFRENLGFYILFHFFPFCFGIFIIFV